MEISWLSLLPPLLVIVSAFVLQNINLSVAFGILSAGLIVTNGSVYQAANLIQTRSWEQIADLDKLYLYAFLVLVACLISLFNHTGSINSFAHYITKHIKTARAIQTSSILISCALFIDDYLSILTTSFIMTPLTDRFGIARQKLAFLVHSLAGPLVILAPISSWVGAITMYMTEAGIYAHSDDTVHLIADPFFLFLETVPFIFYSFLIIGSLLFIVHKHISFGPMSHYEHTHRKTSPYHSTPQPTTVSAHIIDLFLPIIVLITSTFCGILYKGNYLLFGGTNSLVQAVQQTTDLNLVLCLASVIALLTGIALSFLRNHAVLRTLPSIMYAGYQLMYSCIIMLVLTSIFGAMLKSDLYTGNYLATHLLSNMPLTFFPVMFFLATIVVTLAAGGAWAAIALMLPIAIPMLISSLQLTSSLDVKEIPILIPLLGALFSGAVCGDHISPIGGATVMTASGTGITPLSHAYSQILYALPALISTTIAFLLSGYLIHYPLWLNGLLSLSAGMTLCLTSLWLMNKKWGHPLA